MNLPPSILTLLPSTTTLRPSGSEPQLSARAPPAAPESHDSSQSTPHAARHSSCWGTQSACVRKWRAHIGRPREPCTANKGLKSIGLNLSMKLKVRVVTVKLTLSASSTHWSSRSSSSTPIMITARLAGEMLLLLAHVTIIN